MTEPEEDWLDPDIASMKLSYWEKSGLQIYRNYTRSFEDHAIKRFVQAIDLEPLNLTDLRRLTDLVINEDARFLPVLVCAFADDILKEVFKSVLPDRIPGGKAGMFGGYGPLSDLAKRIQLAYAFDILSGDLMIELDSLRNARNTISHSWDINSLSDFFTRGRLSDMERIENFLSERKEITKAFSRELEPEQAFRIRLVWIVARLVYEGVAYNRAKKVRVQPNRVLYGKPTPKWLSEISKIALEATIKVLKNT